MHACVNYVVTLLEFSFVNIYILHTYKYTKDEEEQINACLIQQVCRRSWGGIPSVLQRKAKGLK